MFFLVRRTVASRWAPVMRGLEDCQLQKLLREPRALLVTDRPSWREREGEREGVRERERVRGRDRGREGGREGGS